MRKVSVEKVKWFRYICFTAILLVIIPICERDRVINGAASMSAFAGEEIVCAIDLGDDMRGAHGLETGFTYELISRFAHDNGCAARIIVHNNGDNYLDSLKAGKVDLVITHEEDIADTRDIRLSCKLDECSIAAMKREGTSYSINDLNEWICHMKVSGEFNNLRSRFRKSSGSISPYDRLIQKYAAELDWDWRMLAAVIYQESKFSINSRSHRGAQGLMQVMPSTAARYGIEDLVNPENNIKAGVSHLKMLQNIWKKRNLTPEELIRFTLASYNAGEGKMLECRSFAQNEGYPGDTWEDILKIIPLMREQGLFQGHETIAYIENISALYNSYCEGYPEK
jgi:membrane-bound lytic murein transglycosylase F